jgi:hypothetical protein
MKFRRLRNEHLRNEVWFQFFTEFKALVEQFYPGTLNIEALFAIFITMYGKADDALEVIRKSATTEQLSEADRARDIVFRGFANAVKSALDHFDPAKYEAAKRLKIVFDHYGNVPRKAYDEETASIYNFVQEMNGTYVADVNTLGLNEWVTKLDANNRTFETLLKDRYSENIKKMTYNLAEVRRETDKIYRDIIERIEASIVLNGETTYLPFVNELNIRIDHYNSLIVRNSRETKETEETEG